MLSRTSSCLALESQQVTHRGPELRQADHPERENQCRIQDDVQGGQSQGPSPFVCRNLADCQPHQTCYQTACKKRANYGSQGPGVQPDLKYVEDFPQAQQQ